jgi:hypothetical protein
MANNLTKINITNNKHMPTRNTQNVQDKLYTEHNVKPINVNLMSPIKDQKATPNIFVQY